jgi:uncharacterized protein YndB with AHSA1/START domain
MSSFRVEQRVSIAAPRAKVWASLLDVDGWWCHRLQEGSRVRLEPKVGGRFFEEWGKGNASLWGMVTHVEAPSVLRLAGPLGMTDLGAVHTYEYTLEEKDGGTLLRLSHRCSGRFARGSRASYDGGWKELWKHLKALAASGKRFSEKAR